MPTDKALKNTFNFDIFDELRTKQNKIHKLDNNNLFIQLQIHLDVLCLKNFELQCKFLLINSVNIFIYALKLNLNKF